MKIALLLSFLCFSFCCYAQETSAQQSRTTFNQSFSRGSWLVGAQGAYSRGLLLEHNLSTQAYGGYFVANKILVGLGTSWSRETFETLKSVDYSVGPLVRFQLTRTRFSPFLMASYQIGKRKSSGYYQVSQSTTTVSTGPNQPTVTTHLTTGMGWFGSGVSQTAFYQSFGAGFSYAVCPALRVELVMNWQGQSGSPRSDIRLGNGFYQPQLGINYQLGNAR